MEGLGQLVFILILLAAAAFDAMARGQKKKRRMEEMEREEAEGGTATAERPRSSERYSRAPESRSQEREASGERETADAMIPEDFWAILTGQAPVEPEPEVEERRPRGEDARQAEERRQEEDRRTESASREGTGAEDYRAAGTRTEEYRPRRSTEDPPLRPHIPAPVPSDRYSERDRETPSPARVSPDEAPATRRGARWMEGLEARDQEAAIEEQEAAAYGRIEEPWGEFEDISAGEIGDGSELVGGPIGDGDRAARPGRRPGSGSQYTRLLESGDREDLKKAIVLKEVLGTPAGFREIGHEWGQEP